MKPDSSRTLLHDADQLGHEGRAARDDHAALKLWLRLLSCTTQLEARIRQRMRARFGISLARFDYLAQLHRHPQGLKMKDLSRGLMVTGANVTGLTDELEHEGMVTREVSTTDRRAWLVQLTPSGRSSFELMASEHEHWVLELFGGLDAATLRRLYDDLGTLRVDLMHQRATPKESER